MNISPIDDETFIARSRLRDIPFYRVGIYDNGRLRGYKNFWHEGLADNWADEMRRAYAEKKILGVFIKKEILRG